MEKQNYKKNIILADTDSPKLKKFSDGLIFATNEEWETKSVVCNKSHSGKIKNLIRYIKYFCFPLKYFFKRKSIKGL